MRRRSVRRAARVAPLVAVAWLGALPACSGSPFSRGNACLPAQPVAEPPVVAPGASLTLRSTGFDGCAGYAEPVEYVVVLGFQGRQPPTGLGVVTAAIDGTFSTTVAIPPDASPGPAGITITGSAWDECDDSSSCAGYGAQIFVAGRVVPSDDPGGSGTGP